MVTPLQRRIVKTDGKVSHNRSGMINVAIAPSCMSAILDGWMAQYLSSRPWPTLTFHRFWISRIFYFFEKKHSRHYIPTILIPEWRRKKRALRF